MRRAVSSSIVGGGIGSISWVVNMTVDAAYGRLDPADHLLEIARRLGLTERGVGLMTAVDVRTCNSASLEGASAWATVVFVGRFGLRASPRAPQAGCGLGPARSTSSLASQYVCPMQRWSTRSPRSPKRRCRPSSMGACTALVRRLMRSAWCVARTGWRSSSQGHDRYGALDSRRLPMTRCRRAWLVSKDEPGSTSRRN